MQFKKKKSPIGAILGFLSIIAMVGIGYLYLSPAFEQNQPTITTKEKIYWNLKDKLDIKLEDESGIKYYKVTFKDGKKDIVLAEVITNTIQKNISVDVASPKLDMFYKGNTATIEIEVIDNSKWNLLEGNKAVKTIDITIDKKRPVANVLANSRYIQRGGSAVVVVKVEDENLEDLYVTFNDALQFKLLPYKEDGYFIALVAWPVNIDEFKRVNLVAIDKANNKTVSKIPFYIQKKKIRVDDIKLSEKFIKNVSAFVLEESGEVVPDSLKDIFIYSNKELRAKNLQLLSDISVKSMIDEKIDSFNIKPFRRLRGSSTVAGYAERRHYYLNNEKINEAWHLGIDWASVKNATIKTSNDGMVIFKGYLGLYGNTIVIDHGMGLSSLYAHTSSQKVEIGDVVNAKQSIAKTGATGAVFGDHLHFGMLVQGIEVNPLEWMDRNWIKVRITNVLKNANKQIAGK